MHGSFDQLGFFIGQLIMPGVAPPNQNIRVCQSFGSDALLWVV